MLWGKQFLCLLVFSGGIKWDNLPEMDQSYVLTLLWQRSLSYRFAEQIDWLASNDRDLCCERINLFKILASKKSISTFQKNPIKLYSGKRKNQWLICDNDNNRTKMKKYIFYLRGGVYTIQNLTDTARSNKCLGLLKWF